MKELNRKTPLVFKIGVLLLCAMLVTSYMMSDLYARYTVTAFASDSARVAKFTFTDDQMQMQAQSFVISSPVYPGQTVCAVNATIRNESEVAIRYVVNFENLTGNLPINYPLPISFNVIAPNEEVTVNYPISWPANENSPDYAGKMDIVRITVSVEQVD